MKKKFTAIALALSLSVSAAAFAKTEYNDVPQDSALSEAVETLTDLKILSGMGDGGFHPYENLTRAQFAKIAVYLMGKEENAVSTSVPFMDVPSGHWATGYIGLVSADGTIAGYPDGTFGADEEITYAQAITVVVRTLGYSGEDVGYRWPEGYIEKAQAIGLLDGISIANVSYAITRADAARLCYNALFTDAKSGRELIEQRNITAHEDIVVISDSETDVSLGSGEIKTTAGSFKLSDGIPEDIVGTKGDLYVDKDGNVVIYRPDAESSRRLVVSSTHMNSETNKLEISFIDSGETKTESFSLSHPVYNEGNAYTVGTAAELMTEGSELRLFYDEKGVLQRGVLVTKTMAGPKTVTGDGFSPVNEFGIKDTSTLRVIRKGLTASLDDIERFDVLYYAENTNTLYAYADKVTGIYEKALPIKANVTSIVLSGTTYTLATREAMNKLNESEGAFSINDRVTLLKGRGGEIVDAVDTDSADLQSYGVIQNAYAALSAEDDENKGSGDWRVVMFMGDGTTADYKCDRDYSDDIGDFCKLNFDGGVLSLEKLVCQSISGSFDSSKPSLAGHWFADDYGIIELVSLPEEGAATLRKVSVNEISKDSLSKSEVIHAQLTGSMGDISILYVKNLTNEQYTYGVVKEVEKSKDSSKRTYTLLLGADEREITNSFRLDSGDAVGYGPGSDGANTFISLVEIAQGKKITAKTSGRIKLDDEIYTLSDSAVAYGGDMPKNYRALSLDKLTEIENVSSVKLYSDEPLSKGGAVKVIIVTTK